MAQIAADLEMYDVAIEKYEQVAAAAIDDPLLKWSLKEYCFKAGLCHLCTGVKYLKGSVTYIYMYILMTYAMIVGYG